MKTIKPISLPPLLRSLLTSVVIASATLSCGMLGDKKSERRGIAMEEQGGCLDSLGSQMRRFLDGQVSEHEWSNTWICLEDTLDKFETIVAPSEAQGFTQDDIHGLVRTFLIRKKPVSRDFVISALEAKASLFGGNSRHFSKAEIGKLRAMITLIRSDTPAMIPMLRNRIENPIPENIDPLVTHIIGLGEKLATILNPAGNPTLTKEMATKFMTELAVMTDGGNEYDYRQWAEFLIEAKSVLVRGAPDGIAGDDWKEMIRFGSELGAVVLGLWSADEHEPRFQLSLAEKGRLALDRVFHRWGGVIPYSQLNRMLQSAPHAVLPVRAAEFKRAASCAMQRRFDNSPAGSECPSYRTCPEGADCSQAPRCPSGGCRPAITRLLGGGSNDGLDAKAIDTIMDIYRTGMRGKSHLESIMGGLKEEITPAQFHELADRYSAGLTSTERTEVGRLKRLATEYLGLHPEGSKEIVYRDFSRHSKQNLTYFNWYEKVAEKLLRAYGSSQSPLKGSMDDLYFVTKDFEMVLLSLSMVHPLKVNIHEKRFREANLFTMAGNGDTWMDLKETANYIASLMSISRLSSRIKKDILADRTPEGRARPCKPIGIDSCLKISQYNVQCFRDHFYKNLKDYWRNFPRLWADYEAMSEEQRGKFLRSLEAASKISGMYDETDVSSYDIDSFAGVPHYAEALMKKFDTRNGRADDYLDSYEIHEQVWPTFKTEFKKLSNLPKIAQFINKPLFIYLLRYGGMPFKCQKSPQVGEIAKFAAWMATGAHNDYFRIRRERMFKVFEELSKPIMPGCKGYQPPAVCKGSATVTEILTTLNLEPASKTELTDEMVFMLHDSISEEEKAALLQ